MLDLQIVDSELSRVAEKLSNGIIAGEDHVLKVFLLTIIYNLHILI